MADMRCNLIMSVIAFRWFKWVGKREEVEVVDLN